MWGMITHSAKETGQQKEQLGWGFQMAGKWASSTKLERGRIQAIQLGVFIKQGDQHPWQLCKKILKIFHPPIIKAPPIPGFPPPPPFCLQLKFPIHPNTAICEKSHPPFMKGDLDDKLGYIFRGYIFIKYIFQRKAELEKK